MIERLEADRDKLQMDRPSFELNPADLDQRQTEWPELQQRLELFSSLTVPLHPSKKRQHRERLLFSSQNKLSIYQQRLTDLKRQDADLGRQQRIRPSDIPDQPCAKKACPLFTHFMGEYTHLEERRQLLQKSIATGEHKIRRLQSLVQGLQEQTRFAQPYVDQINWLLRYAQSNPILHHQLRQIDVLHTLKTHPQRISVRLSETYEQLAQWIRLQEVQKDLDTAYAMRRRQASTQSGDTVSLVTQIEKLTHSLTHHRETMTSLSKQIATLSKTLQDYADFSSLKEEVLILNQHHQERRETLSNCHENDLLQFLKRGIEDLRRTHFVRMSEVERTLRAQDTLQARYQEEVISQMATIEKELNDLIQIESALIKIPHEIMTGFINTLFEQANRLIAMVWTIPLSINLLPADNPLNYEFTVSADNDSHREMAECSEGQTEILSLAINLALRIILGHTDIPLVLDEVGKSMDNVHRSHLVRLLKNLIDNQIISQLFLVSHHASIHETFAHTETLVIRQDNVMLPPVWNQHCTIT